MLRLGSLIIALAAGGACVAQPGAAVVAASPAADIAPDSVAALHLMDVTRVEPSIVVEARYATANNFTGAPLPGYEANRVLMRREAAGALGRAQRRALAEGYSLKLFDGYRPVRATLAMVDWTERTGRQDLIRDGYIAARSGHNLGLAIDLTLVTTRDGRELAMGTPYDTFTEAAHTANASGAVAANRATLVRLLAAEGFTNYDKEWWHFSYKVPDPLRFDIVIR
ncbi:MAG: D-alanyl-D-alanine carboxypeptidase family protein [Gemmatimonadaceae bacterium]|nr:D-alanyl-D-alanine carboxypeptidase family protein [Gemmatimonadaceae bacterium]